MATEIVPDLASLASLFSGPKRSAPISDEQLDGWHFFIDEDGRELVVFGLCIRTEEAEFIYYKEGNRIVGLNMKDIRQVSLENYGKLLCVVVRFRSRSLSDLFFSLHPPTIAWGNKGETFHGTPV